MQDAKQLGTLLLPLKSRIGIDEYIFINILHGPNKKPHGHLFDCIDRFDPLLRIDAVSTVHCRFPSKSRTWMNVFNQFLESFFIQINT